MPAIGSHNFIVLSGQIQGFGQTVQDITRPFVDGLALRKLGLRSTPFTLRSVTDVDDPDDADTLFAAYQASQGTVVDITDQAGEDHTNFIVRQVTRAMQRATPLVVGGAGGATDRVVLTCDWQLQAAGNPSAS